MMLNWRNVYSKLPVLAFDGCCIPTAWYFAYCLRFNMQPFPSRFFSMDSYIALAILTVIQIGCYYYFKIYRGLWRFSSLSDFIRIFKAVACATILCTPVLHVVLLLHQIPRSVFPLYCISLITLLCGGRILMRQYWQQHMRNRDKNEVQKVLIIGAGQAGEGIVRDLKRTSSYVPIGFIDDSLAKKGLEVHGVRVLGTTRELSELVIRHNINLILIAIPSARSAAMRRIVNHCERSGVPFRTLPSIQALASGHVKMNTLREVHIEDLLGRDQVELNWDKISAGIYKKRVIITGGGGSIGSELCRQVARLSPLKLLIIDNSEFNLYKIELELKELYPELPLDLALVSVTDEVAVNQIFKQYQPELVFHAAAYKHVPLLENQMRIAVQNNVLGTQVLAEASVAVHVEKFILISTDKAVNPSNVMGTTKRVAEIYCQNLDLRTNTQFITVRFGNVLGSVGSVVPLFQKQLKKGGPITVTHPEIQRYFMTIAEACQLILQAMVNGAGGEIFVLDMGEPIKIRYLAEQLIRLAGKEPDKDIRIEYTGLRPGEKLYEELFHDSELLYKTEHEKLFKARFRKIDWQELTEAMKLLKKACLVHEEKELLILLKNIVPEYQNEALSSFTLPAG